MREDFEAILKTGAATLAAHTNPRPTEAIRARGDRLRRRRSATTAALAIALATAIGGGALAGATLSSHGDATASRVPDVTANDPVC